MANRISRLTKRSVDALKPNGADAVCWDAELTGFERQKFTRAKKS